jgi:hypothetical protein
MRERRIIIGSRQIYEIICPGRQLHNHRRAILEWQKTAGLPVFLRGKVPCAWSDQLEDFLAAEEARSRRVAEPV